MKHTRVALLAVLGLACGFGGYSYWQHLEEKRAAQARADTALAVRLALEQQRKATEVSAQEQERLVAEAKGWLDEWGGEGELLTRASANLERVLKANPRNARARVEMARVYLRKGFINYRNYQPGALEKATWELDAARQADPQLADVYVALGNVYFLGNAPRQALAALEKAQAMGSDNPWLDLNFADAYIDLDQWSEAEARLRKANGGFAARPPAKRLLVAYYEKMAAVHMRFGRTADADATYKAQIEADPGSAWVRGNYATFLLLKRGLPDAAISEAQQALQIMNYSMARLTLAAARYAKWAELKRSAPDQAAEYLRLAKGDTPNYSWIMPQAAANVGTGPAIQGMVRELMALGVPIDTKDEHGDTGLTLAAYEGRVDSIALLLKYGASIEARDNMGQTALMSAAHKGHLEAVRALIARGASINAQDNQGMSATYLAVVSRNEPMVRTLVGLKANVNLANAVGYTPLMGAASTGDLGLVRLLLDAGADPALTTTQDKKTAADIAEARGHRDLAAGLRTTSAKSAPIRR